MPYIGKKPADIIATVIDTTTGTFSGDLTVDTNTLYVDSANNRVGVGTASPDTLLHLSSSSPFITFTDTDNSAYAHVSMGSFGGISFNADVGNTRPSSDIKFLVDNTERMRIDSSGNVGINVVPETYSNGRALQINSSAINDDNAGSLHITHNGYFNSAWKYVENGTAEKITYGLGAITFSNASNNSSGADASLTWSEAMRIDSSGNVGIGTSSPADSFTGSSLDATGVVIARGNLASHQTSAAVMELSGDEVQYRAYGATAGTGYMTFNVGGGGASTDSEAMRIDSSGRVGIGTSSAGSFTSASAQNLVVGSGSGNAGMTIYSGTSGYGGLAFADGTGLGNHYRGLLQYYHASDAMLLFTSEIERMRIDSSGNVGIGTSSPRAPLHIYPSGSASDDFNLLVSQFRPNIVLEDLSTNATDYQLFVDGDDLQFRYGDASTDTKLANEAMRVDSSGNLLVGTIDTTPYNNSAGSTADNGIALGGTGILAIAKFNDSPLIVNRTGTNDGGIIKINKSGSEVGSIGTNGGSLYIDGGSSNYSVMLASDFRPRTANGAANNDGNIDLGDSGAKWKDLYLSGGVYLGGTGSANFLSDYEEGGFTPTYQVDGGTNPTITYDIQQGTYVKVGNLVNVSVTVRTDSVSGGGAGDLFVSLPFNVKNTSDLRSTGVVQSGSWGSDFPNSVQAKPAEAKALLLAQDFNSNRFSLDKNDLASGANSNLVHFSISYITE